MNNLLKGAIVLFTLLQAIACNKANNQVNITFNFDNKYDRENFSIPYLRVENQDSVFFEGRPSCRSFKDTIKIMGLKEGAYKISYLNVLGEKLTNCIILKEHIKPLTIWPDSVSVSEYYQYIPFKKLKEGHSYTVKSYYGGVAGMHAFYKVSKKNNKIFYEASNQKEHILSKDDITSLQRYEAYLLGVAHFNKDIQYGIDSHTIIQNEDSTIIYFYRWQESRKFYPTIYKKEFDTRD